MMYQAGKSMLEAIHYMMPDGPDESGRLLGQNFSDDRFEVVSTVRPTRSGTSTPIHRETYQRHRARCSSSARIRARQALALQVPGAHAKPRRAPRGLPRRLHHLDAPRPRRRAAFLREPLRPLPLTLRAQPRPRADRHRPKGGLGARRRKRHAPPQGPRAPVPRRLLQRLHAPTPSARSKRPTRTSTSRSRSAPKVALERLARDPQARVSSARTTTRATTLANPASRFTSATPSTSSSTRACSRKLKRRAA